MSKRSRSKGSGGKKGNKDTDDFDALINEAIKENQQLTTSQSLNLPPLKTTQPSLSLEPFDINVKYEKNQLDIFFEWYILTHDHLIKQLNKDAKLALNNKVEGLFGLKNTLTLINQEEDSNEVFIDKLIKPMSSIFLDKIHLLQAQINAIEKPLCPHSITDKIERLSKVLSENSATSKESQNELESILGNSYTNYDIPSTAYSLFATAHLNVGTEYLLLNMNCYDSNYFISYYRSVLIYAVFT